MKPRKKRKCQKPCGKTGLEIGKASHSDDKSRDNKAAIDTGVCVWELRLRGSRGDRKKELE